VLSGSGAWSGPLKSRSSGRDRGGVGIDSIGGAPMDACRQSKPAQIQIKRFHAVLGGFCRQFVNRIGEALVNSLMKAC
jgi:hypothetical protein